MTLTRITSDGISDGSIVNADLHSAANIAGTKLADDAITQTKIAAGAVGTTEIATGAISHTKLAANAVETDNIANGTIVNADINASAAIAGSKISPSFTSDITITDVNPALLLVDSNNNSDYELGNQDGTFRLRDSTNTTNRMTLSSTGQFDFEGNVDCNAGLDVTGDITGNGDLTITSTGPTINLVDSNDNPDYRILVNSGLFKVRDTTNNSDRFIINTDGHVDVLGNLDVGAGLDVTGNISVSGTVDGRDLATDGSKLDGIASGATNVSNTNQLTNGAGFLTSVGTSNISNNAVTLAKVQDVQSGSILGRQASGAGDLQELGAANIRAMINVADGANNITNNNQLTNGAGYITSATNNFVSSASFNTGNGVLTLNRSGLGTVTVDLDGRFATGTIPTNNNQLSNGRGFVTANQSTTSFARTLENSRTGSAPNYALRGWVNFDGRGSISIRGNGNVSSISDFGTGNYRVNFSTSMADGNYSTTTLGGYDQTGGTAPFIIFSNGGFDGSPLQYNSSGVRCGSTYADFRYATLMFAR